MLFEYLKDPAIKLIVVGELIIAAIFTFYNAYVLSFVVFWEPDNAYTYVHSYRTAHVLEQRVKDLLYGEPSVQVGMYLKEYWPYPFLLRDYASQVLYLGEIKGDHDYPIIISALSQHKEVMATLKGKDYISEVYPVRSAVTAELLVERQYFKQKMAEKRNREMKKPLAPK